MVATQGTRGEICRGRKVAWSTRKPGRVCWLVVKTVITGLMKELGSQQRPQRLFSECALSRGKSRLYKSLALKSGLCWADMFPPHGPSNFLLLITITRKIRTSKEVPPLPQSGPKTQNSSLIVNEWVFISKSIIATIPFACWEQSGFVFSHHHLVPS